jgi:hypothetical protein
MYPDMPYHLRLSSHLPVLVMEYILLTHERLEVGAKADAIRWVDIDHLHLTAQSLVAKGEFITTSESPRIIRFTQLSRYS